MGIGAIAGRLGMYRLNADNVDSLITGFQNEAFRKLQEVPDWMSAGLFVAKLILVSEEILLMKADGKYIGFVAVSKEMNGFHQVPIGIFDRYYRDSGCGSAALKFVCDELDGFNLVQKIRPSNPAMLALSRKCGFIEVGMEDGFVRMERKCQQAD